MVSVLTDSRGSGRVKGGGGVVVCPDSERTSNSSNRPTNRRVIY